MNKEELINYFLTDNKSGYKTKEKHVLNKFPELLNKINEFIENSEYSSDIHFTQKLYNFLYNVKNIVVCKNCGKEIKWRNRFTEGYLNYCSTKCKGKSEDRKEKAKQFNLKKYGVEYASQREDVKEKKKKTFLNKYGKENIFEVDIIKEKTKQSNLVKYGTEFAIQSDIILNKRKKNNLEKYGVEHTSKLKNVENKKQNTNLEKYGVEHVMHVNEIKNKLITNKNEKRFAQYRDILNNQNIIFKIIGNDLKVINHCPNHNEYVINRTTFYYRILHYNVENPCPICNPIDKRSSVKELEVKNYIEDKLNYKTKKHYINRKEIDIYIPEKNIGIEFNGLYWHSELFLDKNYHNEKYLLAKENNIQLLHIFEDEWVNKKEIVKSMINNKLGLIQNKIYARKCEIKEVTFEKSKLFLDMNHIQGNYNSKHNIGLYYNKELVSLMCFTKIRFEKNVNGYELTRFCNKINTSVIGGASKLLKYFIKKHNPRKIISFADLRYSNGNLYEKLGFLLIEKIKPSYYYFNPNENKTGLKRHSRLEFKKQLIITENNKNLTEHEIMLSKGYVRIYNAGNLKFELIL
jgi:hypothetical protein